MIFNYYNYIQLKKKLIKAPQVSSFFEGNLILINIHTNPLLLIESYKIPLLNMYW